MVDKRANTATAVPIAHDRRPKRTAEDDRVKEKKEREAGRDDEEEDEADEEEEGEEEERVPQKEKDSRRGSAPDRDMMLAMLRSCHGKADLALLDGPHESAGATIVLSSLSSQHCKAICALFPTTAMAFKGKARHEDKPRAQSILRQAGLLRSVPSKSGRTMTKVGVRPWLDSIAKLWQRMRREEPKLYVDYLARAERICFDSDSADESEVEGQENGEEREQKEEKEQKASEPDGMDHDDGADNDADDDGDEAHGVEQKYGLKTGDADDMEEDEQEEEEQEEKAEKEEKELPKVSDRALRLANRQRASSPDVDDHDLADPEDGIDNCALPAPTSLQKRPQLSPTEPPPTKKTRAGPAEPSALRLSDERAPDGKGTPTIAALRAASAGSETVAAGAEARTAEFRAGPETARPEQRTVRAGSELAAPGSEARLAGTGAAAAAVGPEVRAVEAGSGSAAATVAGAVDLRAEAYGAIRSLVSVLVAAVASDWEAEVRQKKQ